MTPYEISQLIGVTEGQLAVKIQGLRYFCKVVMRDGMFYPATNDHDLNRLKIHVMDGVVVKVRIG